MMGSSNAQDDLERTGKQLRKLLVLSSTGISHSHCLFNHYFTYYNEVFNSKGGAHVEPNVPEVLYVS